MSGESSGFGTKVPAQSCCRALVAEPDVEQSLGMTTSAPLSPVFVGVDGSSHSDLAVRWAAAYAAERGHPLVIVHATEDPSGGHGREDLKDPGTASPPQDPRVVKDALTLSLDTSPGLRVSTHVAWQDPRALLAREAAGGSLLVLGARGRGPIAGLLLGSVTTALTTRPPCPLVVVRPEPTSAESTRLPVVVGVDGDEDSTGAVSFAFEMASWHDRNLMAVYALGVANAYSYFDVPSDEQVRRLRAECKLRVAESLAGHAETFPEVSVDTVLSSESAARALNTASATAHLIVVGTRGRGPLAARFLGSVSRSVVEHAHCTVAVVPGRS